MTFNLPINQVIHGDCLEVMKSWPDKCIDLVLTDPPYGIGADKKNAHSSIRDNPQWDDNSWDNQRPNKDVFYEILRIGKKIAIWGGNYFSDYLPVSAGWIVWIKPEADTGFSLADGELCWTSESFSLRVKYFPRRDGFFHPTQKPIGLMEYCIDKFSEEGQIICDPFGGSCTTAVAAENLKRKWICIEKEEKYVNICRERISSLTAHLF